jgi:hypothetical protein
MSQQCVLACDFKVKIKKADGIGFYIDVTISNNISKSPNFIINNNILIGCNLLSSLNL